MTQALQQLKFMAFDIDGVMTDGTLTYLPDGTETKTFYTLDGAGIRMLQQSGIVVGWITGRSSSAVAHRAKNLGITHLAQGVSDKHNVLGTWLQEAGLDFSQAGFIIADGIKVQDDGVRIMTKTATDVDRLCGSDNVEPVGECGQ